MRYRCLVFDHDDTTVNSTATIHCPCFQKFLAEYYPGRTITLEEYFLKNFEPGFVKLCMDEYGMDEKALKVETDYWLEYVKNHIPVAYDGIRDIMLRQKDEGGYIAVISHSMEHNIYRDYEANGLPVPDLVFGWGQPMDRRKPNPWPLEQVIAQLGLRREEVLMIDDLKPGYDMAQACGVDFAAAGWANDIEYIENFMRKNSSNYFKTVQQLRDFLFEE